MRRVPWVALLALITALGLRAAALLEPLIPWLPGCAFKRLTGVACATCGLTRCVVAMGRGDWSAAFHWHPAAASALLLPVAAAWDLRRAWLGAPYPALSDARWARIAAWALLAAVWSLQVARGI